MPNVYDKGNLVRCRGCFTTRALTAAEATAFAADGSLPGGVGVDPTVVKFDLRQNNGTVTTDTYPSVIVKLATGSYYRDVDASTGGEWDYRFYSTGTGQAAAESTFLTRSDF